MATVTQTKPYRLRYSPPAPEQGTTISNCNWRDQQTGKTRFSDLFYQHFQCDTLLEMEAYVAANGLEEADYCADWILKSAAEKAEIMRKSGG